MPRAVDANPDIAGNAATCRSALYRKGLNADEDTSDGIATLLAAS
jgi:hypothetical protein